MTVLARFRARWKGIDPLWIDAVVVAVLLGLLVFELVARSQQPGQRPSDLLAYLLAAVLAGSYALHRRYPMTAVVVVSIAVLVYSAREYVAYPALPMFAILAAVSLRTDRRRALYAVLICGVTLFVAVSLQPEGVADASTRISSLLALAVAWLWGENQRNRRARWMALEDRARRLEAEREEQARYAVARERLRIARELHDIVAHSMSVIAVQSGVANHVIDSQPEQARRALGTIEATSRDALVEMRRLLGVLRNDDVDPGLAPNPGLAQLPDLVRQMRDAGLTVDLRLDGDRSVLTQGVDLSAYRIVQEGLTNVLRHGGPHARVTVHIGAAGVAIEVLDDGRAAGSPNAGPAGAGGPGHGLVGMRERVAVYGGELRAGPTPDGGYRLTARLPYLSSGSPA